MSWLKEENDGYFFRHNQPEEIFNTAHILYYVRKLMKQKSKLDDSWDPSVILNIQYLLISPLTRNKHCLLKTTLDLIVNNSHY